MQDRINIPSGMSEDEKHEMALANLEAFLLNCPEYDNFTIDDIIEKIIAAPKNPSPLRTCDEQMRRILLDECGYAEKNKLYHLLRLTKNGREKRNEILEMSAEIDI